MMNISFNQSSLPAALSANDAMLLNIALGRWRKWSKRSLFKAMKAWGTFHTLFFFYCMDCGLLETLTDQNACIINNYANACDLNITTNHLNHRDIPEPT